LNLELSGLASDEFYTPNRFPQALID